jgi:hypothetical protein
MCALYTNTFLPYGRFYNRLGGNIGMLAAYMYVFLYLGVTSLRRPYWLELYFYFIFNKLNFLKNIKENNFNLKNSKVQLSSLKLNKK